MPSSDSTSSDHDRVLGISFFNGTAVQAVEHLKGTGGLAVMPASPALIKLNYDTEYRLALQKADLALPDSGLLVLLWRLTSGRRLRKISACTCGIFCCIGRVFIASEPHWDFSRATNVRYLIGRNATI